MDYASSIHAVALRVVKLGVDGAPLVGATNAFVTSQFTRVSFTPEYEVGEEISEKGADGTVCVYFKAPDTLKRVNVNVAICNPQPELYEMLADGSLLMGDDPDGATGPLEAEAIGWAAPLIGEEPNPNGLGLEVWSRAIVGGKMAGTNPYWRWVFPFVKLRMDGERALENGVMAHSFTGEGLGNPAFGDGPVGDWTFPTDSALQYVRTATAPTGVNDYVEVVADV